MGQTLAAVAAVGQVVGGVFGARGALEQGEAESAAAKSRRDALLRHGREEEMRLRRSGRRALAAQRLSYAKAGVRLEGSPLDLLTQNAAELEAEAVDARTRSFQAAGLEDARAKEAKRQARLQAYASLLGGGARGASSAYASGLLGSS